MLHYENDVVQYSCVISVTSNLARGHGSTFLEPEKCTMMRYARVTWQCISGDSRWRANAPVKIVKVMNRRARAKGKMHSRDDEGRVVNHAPVCARACARWRLDRWLPGRLPKPTRANEPESLVCASVYVPGGGKIGDERMEGKYRKLGEVRELGDSNRQPLERLPRVRRALFDKASTSNVNISLTLSRCQTCRLNQPACEIKERKMEFLVLFWRSADIFRKVDLSDGRVFISRLVLNDREPNLRRIWRSIYYPTAIHKYFRSYSLL